MCTKVAQEYTYSLKLSTDKRTSGCNKNLLEVLLCLEMEFFESSFGNPEDSLSVAELFISKAPWSSPQD